MLKALAARRCGDIPDNVSVHYVSQEVQLTEVTTRLLVYCIHEIISFSFVVLDHKGANAARMCPVRRSRTAVVTRGGREIGSRRELRCEATATTK